MGEERLAFPPKTPRFSVIYCHITSLIYWIAAVGPRFASYLAAEKNLQATTVWIRDRHPYDNPKGSLANQFMDARADHESNTNTRRTSCGGYPLMPCCAIDRFLCNTSNASYYSCIRGHSWSQASRLLQMTSGERRAWTSRRNRHHPRELNGVGWADLDAEAAARHASVESPRGCPSCESHREADVLRARGSRRPDR